MNRRLDIMLDLETAGPAPDGAIVSIGWCVFDRDRGPLGPVPGYEPRRVDVIVESCLDIGMVIDPDTVKWWLSQEAEVRRLWNAPGAVPIREALRVFAAEFAKLDAASPSGHSPLIWAYPATFDLSIFDRAYQLAEMPKGFDRRTYACSRSVMKALGYRRSDERVPKQWRAKHLPEADAVRQAIQLQLCLNPELDRGGDDPLGYPGDAVARFD